MHKVEANFRSSILEAHTPTKHNILLESSLLTYRSQVLSSHAIIFHKVKGHCYVSLSFPQLGCIWTISLVGANMTRFPHVVLPWQSLHGASLMAQMVNNVHAMWRPWVRSLSEDPLKRSQQPTQDPCPENSMDRGAWWATIHGVAEPAHGWALTHTLLMQFSLLIIYNLHGFNARVFKNIMGLKDPGFESWHWHGLDL